MALPKISLNDGKHKLIVAEDGERVLTPEENKNYEMQHPNARREPMRASVYDGGGDVAAYEAAATGGNQSQVAPAPNSPKKEHNSLVDEMPGQQAPQFGTETTPLMNQMYDKGGDVYGGAEAEGLKSKSENIDQYNAGVAAEHPSTQMRIYEPSSSDHMHSGDRYGMRSGEKRLSPQGDVVDPTTPQGMGASGPKLPVSTALYDEGGDVDTEDEIMNRQELGHGTKMGRADNTRQQMAPQLDTEPAERPAPLAGGRMIDPNYQKGDSGMQMDNSPVNPEDTIKDPQVPLRDTGEGKAVPVISEASTRPKAIAAPRPTAMKSAIETPVSSGTTDHPDAPQGGDDLPVVGEERADKTKVASPALTPEMKLVQQDQKDAMLKGDLVKLGMANINARTLKMGGAPEQQEPGAPTAEDNLKNQRAELKHKMVNGATEQERFQAEKDLAELNRKSPWGSEGNHPGLLGKLAHGVSTIAQGVGQGIAPYAVNAIPGSQGQLATQEARGEQGVEQAQKKEQQAATTAVEQGKPEMQQEQQRITEEKNKMQHDAQLRQRGYKTDATGAEVPIPYEELSTHEQGVYDLNQAKGNAQNAIAELKQAQADPESPQSQLILAKAKAEGEKMDQAAQKLGLNLDTYKAQYLGLDHNNNPLPGVQTTLEGKAVGTKVGAGAAKGTKFTANQSMKADLAENVVHNIDEATKLIRDNPGLFGKVAGRFTSVAQMTGSDDKAIAQLGLIIHNTALATNGIHGLRSAQAIEGTEKELINKFKNSPEATIAALKENRRSVGDFLKDGGKPLIADPDLVPKGASAEVLDKAGNVTGHVVNNKYVPLPKE